MTRRKVLAKREPSGKVQRTPPLPSATEVSRLRDAALAGLRDPVWGTMLGRLYLAGKISGVQFAAGKRWSDLAADYSAICLSPKTSRTVALDPKGGTPSDPDSAKGVREAQRHSQITHQYLAALAILKHTGDVPRLAVRDTCELSLMPAGALHLAALGQGLTVLAAFWGKRK